MTKRKLTALLLAAVLFALPFYGCTASDLSVIRMDIAAPVQNLDPQFATDPAAQMILANLFEGLMVQGADGSLHMGVAREVDVSPDGLVYTFTLREDARWQDGERVSAGDFVFAFRRIFSPQAPSPFAGEFLAISAAQRVLDGEAPLQTLGVAARGENTLVFTLERPQAGFLESLASTAALPCNRRAFEESRGRYGLEARYVHSNGPFSLTRWDNTRVHLERSESFWAAESVLPERVTLYIGRSDPLRQFLDGNSDIVQIPSGRQAEINERQAQLAGVERTVWGLVFNQNVSPWGNPLLRQSLALTLDRGSYAQTLPAWLRPTGVFVPPGVLIDEQSFRYLAGEVAQPFDSDGGRRLYRRWLEVSGYGRLPSTNIFAPETQAAHIQPLEAIWLRELNVDISVVPAQPEQIAERLRTGNYGVMLLPFYPTAGGPGALLGAFYSGNNRFGYNSPRFDHELTQAARSGSREDALLFYSSAERVLLEDAAVIPIYFETTYYAIAHGLSGIEVFPFGGRILFQGAQRDAS